MLLEKLRKNRNGHREVLLPAVDTQETDKEIVLSVDLPGVDKSSLNVELQGQTLTVSGTRTKEKFSGKYTPLIQERAPEVEYHRVFEINAGVDPDKISAKYEEGVLKVTLLKKPDLQAKKVTIA